MDVESYLPYVLKRTPRRSFQNRSLRCCIVWRAAVITEMKNEALHNVFFSQKSVAKNVKYVFQLKSYAFTI